MVGLKRLCSLLSGRKYVSKKLWIIFVFVFTLNGGLNDIICHVLFCFLFLMALLLIFFLSGFAFTDTDDSQDSREREGTIFYPILPPPLTHEYSDIYLQLCMWGDYHIFSIAPLVFSRLLLDEIYHFIELPFDWMMMWS